MKYSTLTRLLLVAIAGILPTIALTACGDEAVERDHDPVEKVEPRPMPGTKLLVDQSAGVACRVPLAWSVLQADATGCVVNPGFTKGQSLDVTVTLHCVPLDANTRTMSPATLLALELPSTRKSLSQSGITTSDPAEGVQEMTVGGQQAAFVVMQAETSQQRRGMVWFALRVAGDKCLALNSIFLDGKESTHLPDVKNAFETLVPASEAKRIEVKSPEPVAEDPVEVTTREDVMILKKHEFRDPGFGGIVSHRIYLPVDWKGDAGVRWTNTTNFAHFIGSFEGPDGASITYDYNRHLCNSTFKQSLDRIRMAIAADPTGYTSIAWPPTRRGQIAAEHIVPKLRPGARNIQIVNVHAFPQAEAALRQQWAPVIQQLQPDHTLDLWVHRVHVTYEQGDRQWEEYVQYVSAINKIQHRSQFFNADTGMVDVWSVRTFRAPRGQLAQKFPGMRKIADTLRPTPQWALSYNQLRTEISRIRHQGRMKAIAAFGERARLIAKTNSQISEMQMASWRKQQAARERIQKATVNSIHEVHDYTSRSGAQIPINHSYSRVFEDPLGNLIMTNDPSYDPRTDPKLETSNWQQLQRIRHLGR